MHFLVIWYNISINITRKRYERYEFKVGRAKYSDDKRKDMLLMFIQTARDIIDTEGIDQVTIRKIAKASGYNSATIYLYFHDLDELICLASLGYVEGFIRSWAEGLKKPMSTLETYCFSWEMFSSYAFKYPHVYNHLFFYHHSRPFSETVKYYHELFPERLEDIGTIIEEILLGSPHIERESSILLPLTRDGQVKEEDLPMISTLASCHFRKLLDTKCRLGDEADDKELVQQQLKAVHYLLKM